MNPWVLAGISGASLVVGGIVHLIIASYYYGRLSQRVADVSANHDRLVGTVRDHGTRLNDHDRLIGTILGGCPLRRLVPQMAQSPECPPA